MCKVLCPCLFPHSHHHPVRDCQRNRNIRKSTIIQNKQVVVTQPETSNNIKPFNEIQLLIDIFIKLKETAIKKNTNDFNVEGVIKEINRFIENLKKFNKLTSQIPKIKKDIKQAEFIENTQKSINKLNLSIKNFIKENQEKNKTENLKPIEKSESSSGNSTLFQNKTQNKPHKNENISSVIDDFLGCNDWVDILICSFFHQHNSMSQGTNSSLIDEIITFSNSLACNNRIINCSGSIFENIITTQPASAFSESASSQCSVNSVSVNDSSCCDDFDCYDCGDVECFHDCDCNDCDCNDCDC